MNVMRCLSLTLFICVPLPNLLATCQDSPMRPIDWQLADCHFFAQSFHAQMLLLASSQLIDSQIAWSCLLRISSKDGHLHD